MNSRNCDGKVEPLSASKLVIFNKNEITRYDKLSAHLESKAKNDWQSTQNMKKGSVHAEVIEKRYRIFV